MKDYQAPARSGVKQGGVPRELSDDTGRHSPWNPSPPTPPHPSLMQDLCAASAIEQCYFIIIIAEPS